MDSVYTGLGQTTGCLLGGKLISTVGGIAIAFQYESFLLLLTASFLFIREYHGSVLNQNKRIKHKDP